MTAGTEDKGATFPRNGVDAQSLVPRVFPGSDPNWTAQFKAISNETERRLDRWDRWFEYLSDQDPTSTSHISCPPIVSLKASR